MSTTGIAAAASAWNSQQNFTTVLAASTADDFHIQDDSSIEGLGDLELFGYNNGGPGGGAQVCYLKPSRDCAGICFNIARLYRVILRINNNNVGGAASDWAPVWGTTFNQAVDLIVQKTMSHELGHFFGETEIDAPANCTNPIIMSIK